MSRRFGGNVHIIIGASIALIALVSIVVGWLGWRLLSREEALARRDRLEQRADALVQRTLRKLAETDAWLGRMAADRPLDDPSASPLGKGAVLIRFSDTGVEIAPPAALVYQPVIPAQHEVGRARFAAADRLEFQSHDLAALSQLLATMTRDSDVLVRSEALLRLARTERRRKHIDAALTAYAQLADVMEVGPAEVPYGLASRSERLQILRDAGRGEDARREAIALAHDLDAGRWPLGRDAYRDYSALARARAGISPELSSSSKTALSVADLVHSTWDEWQQFRQGRSSTMTQRLHRSGDVPALGLVNATRERLTMVLYTGTDVRNLSSDATGDRDTEVRFQVLDEQGRPLAGGEVTETTPAAVVTRSLSAGNLPWQLRFVSSEDAPLERLLTVRRTYFVLALAAVVLMMTAACYALARGVLREAGASRLQSDFVSAVSHEFRSPLTTLRQLTELLAEGRIEDESRRRLYFDVLQRETARLHQLVEDLLDFGRIDAGRRQYRHETIDFAALARDSVEEYRDEAQRSGHTIELRGSGPLLIEGDREALARVVRNLLENAVKYSPDAPAVWVETGAEQDTAVLRVRDSGIGIAPGEQSRIFDKFVRGDAAKRACINGTGIGLSMVRDIVLAHGGHIDVQSEAGSGSTFIVHLPASAAATGTAA